MIFLIIYIILFLIFLKINKSNTSKKKNISESFTSLNDQIRQCGHSCRCLYYTNNQSKTSEDSEEGSYGLEQMEMYYQYSESDLGEDNYLPGQRAYEQALIDSGISEETTEDGEPLSIAHGGSRCELCFPDNTITNGMSYNPVCANETRLRACNCGVKGLCSPCQEDMDKAHIYALQNMCVNRGYIWKYSSGARGKTRGYVWDCLHTRETCIKESIKVLKHPENDPDFLTSDKYFEWDDISGVCTLASPYVRNMCEGENDFWYDARGSVRGNLKCHINPKYCNNYAQDAFKQHDCFIYFGQLVAENLFNTVGVRCARTNCGVDGCPEHHPPGKGTIDIDVRDNNLAKLNCDDNVKMANCSAEFMWDMYGPNRRLTENANQLIPYNNENSVCNGRSKILTEEEKNSRCRL